MPAEADRLQYAAAAAGGSTPQAGLRLRRASGRLLGRRRPGAARGRRRPTGPHPGGTGTADGAVQVGRITGADPLVLGNVFELGGSQQVNARVVDMQMGEIAELLGGAATLGLRFTVSFPERTPPGGQSQRRPQPLPPAGAGPARSRKGIRLPTSSGSWRDSRTDGRIPEPGRAPRER